jgi:hypothetical protein
VSRADLFTKMKHTRESAPASDPSKTLELFPFRRREHPLKCRASATIKDPAQA